MKICFIDSGVGGYITYLSFCEEFIKKNMSNARKSKIFVGFNSQNGVKNNSINKKNDKNQKTSVELFYFADALNSPYGAKDKKQIEKILFKLVRKLRKKYDISVFVLACNTATACAISKLRKTFKNNKFIGVEPAIKPAIATSGKVLVMLTSGTYFYSKYVRQYLSNADIYFLPLTNLAKEIDLHLKDEKYLSTITEKILFPFIDKGINKVVLGCTHYNFLIPHIKKIFPNTTFFEASNAVAKRTLALINE